MEDKSVFIDKTIVPDDQQLAAVLGKTYPYWNLVENYTFLKYPSAESKWSFPGQKYGWSYSIRDKKRAIVYLLPRDNYFKAAFVFGQKASDKILGSDISDAIKRDLSAARVFAEGRGIRVDIRSKDILSDIKKLIDIKLQF